MNANARKVHRIGLVFGVACAVAAALPCAAGETTAALDTVTVQGQSIPPDSSAPSDKDKDKGQGKKKRKAAAEENIGFFSGLALGAVAGGPFGAIAGGITGALLGEHYHKQKLANHELAADLSGSNADKAKLTRTVTQLDGTLQHAQDLTLNIAFRTGDAHLTTEDIDQLTTLGQLASSMPGVKIRVSGHSDPRGPQDYNKSLSQDRAESVAAVLENSGLPQERIVIEALGAGGASETGNLDDYALQRRVSVKLMGETGVVAAAQAGAVTVASAE